MTHTWSALGTDRDDRWQARCSCGWQSAAHVEDDVAIGQMDEHLAAVRTPDPVTLPAQRDPDVAPLPVRVG